MGEQPNSDVIDVVRWTFTADASRRAPIEDYLLDLGLDVSVRGEGQFVVLWDEPEADCDYDAVIEELWALNGAPFEVTHEAFRRLDLLIFHPEEPTDGAADRAVA